VNGVVRVSPRGAARWAAGHPWIFRTDCQPTMAPAGIVLVEDGRGRPLGQALHSPASEIRLRLLERTDRPITPEWWRERIAAAAERRTGIDANAYRIVHAEGDGLPSLVIDRYDRWVVAQLLSAGLETERGPILQAIHNVLAPEGILLRHDTGVRRREGLTEGVEQVAGTVPQEIDIREGAVHYSAAPWTGQKTGAFLDQRPSRVRLAAEVKPGARALDCFAYHGSFALHLAAQAREVVAIDVSADALTRGAANAARNGFTNITWQQGDAFDLLRTMERGREQFDVIALDPPAFAKSRQAVEGALRGYREVNLRAMRLLAPGGVLLTASCSFHVGRAEFLGVVQDAAADSGRALVLEAILGQGTDHPEVLTIPETGYLKGALLRAR
jgi:23S rRNA (cytosine1962-C5)-methyltransferase